MTGGLDEMTSAKDFRLFSWKNGLILSGIVIAVLIPVGIRYYFRDSIAAAAAVEEGVEEGEGEGGHGLERGSSAGVALVGSGGVRGTGGLIFLDDDDDEENGDEDDIERVGAVVDYDSEGEEGGGRRDEASEADELPSSLRKPISLSRLS